MYDFGLIDLHLERHLIQVNAFIHISRRQTYAFPHKPGERGEIRN